MVISTFGIYSRYKLQEKSSKFYPLLIQVPRGKMMTETKPLIASKQSLFYFYFRSFQRHRRARELTSSVLQFLLGPFSPKRNWRQCVCKILGWQTKSIMVCYGTFWSRQFPTTAPLHWLSINPLRFIFYNPRSTDFEENIEGRLGTG